MIIGAAGTAKNTGKTTTTSAILGELDKKNISVGLTSIGYDGEEVDNITGLPKPRLLLKKGTVIATAKKCLQAGTAELQIIEATGIMTPLGRIIIAMVKEEGTAVIAGPNKSSELSLILKILIQKMGCKFVMVDGALNRMAPMVETDGIILATGAARNNDINELVKETKALYELFNLPEATDAEKSMVVNVNKISIIYDEEQKHTLRYAALIDRSTVNEIRDKLEDAPMVYIPAVLSETMLKELNGALGELWAKKTLIIKDPIKLIVGGNPGGIIDEVRKILDMGGCVKVLKKLPILTVTVNPFYPLYRYDGNNYEPGYVDKNELKSKMKAAVPIPVVDVVADGPLELVKVLSIKQK
jgi:hypothetical protein